MTSIHDDDVVTLQEDEFNLRIRHDFTKYILLTYKNGSLCEEGILKTVSQLEGYKRHKAIKYRDWTSHIIVMFETAILAAMASNRLNKMNCGLRSNLVDFMLRNWFVYEIETSRGPHCSLTIVDIIGTTPLNLNFLTSNILHEIFEDFGSPYLLPYTAALDKPHMQVMFASMTEALAACFAFGEWYSLNDKTDCFFYRVRINPSRREESLIRNCGGTPSEAFKLSYFVNIKDGNPNKADSVIENKVSKTEATTTNSMQKLDEQKRACTQNSSRQLNIFGHGLPVLYVPIIVNVNTQEANKYFGLDFTTALSNLQQDFKTKVNAIPNSETKNNTIIKSQNGECSEYKRPEPPTKTSDCNKISKNSINVSTRSRGINRRAIRIYKRRS